MFKRKKMKINKQEEKTEVEFEIDVDISFMDNLNIYKITKLSLGTIRHFYDSRWEVTVECTNDSINNAVIKVIRYDDETSEGLVRALSNVTSINDIKALDLRDHIFYD